MKRLFTDRLPVGLTLDFRIAEARCDQVCEQKRPQRLFFFYFIFFIYLKAFSRFSICSSLSGAKLDDFADFTTFGIATSLLLRTPDLLDNILCMCYVLSVFVRLCFFSSGEL